VIVGQSSDGRASVIVGQVVSLGQSSDSSAGDVV
jgi:hypothetical protein